MQRPGLLPWTSGNRLQLLTGGHEFFPALVSAIDAAQRSVFLESYIFAKDSTTEQVAEALAQAAQRGVQVHVLVDGFGASHFERDFGNFLRQSLVRYQIYRPEHTPGYLPWHFLRQFRRNRLRRLHRKLLVVDETLALVGGINIIDDHNAPEHLVPRCDFAARVQGPAARQVHHAALREWTMVARSGFKASFKANLYHLQQRWIAEYRHLRSLITNAEPDTQAQQVRFLLRDNIHHRHSIANAYLSAINSAKDSIYLAHAYFLPGYRFRQALRDAAERGVRVTLILQGNSDHPLLHYATQALYGNLLRAGIQIYEFSGGFLHAKVGLVDGIWSTVGSSNIDPFSLTLAHEGNLEIRDTEFGVALNHALEAIINTQVRPITKETLNHAGLISRISRWAAYGLVKFLIVLAGYGAHHEMH